MADEKIQRLSEGFDFIEEACGFGEPLTFEDSNEITISESEQEKSPYKILGKARGCFAPIGEFSRNKRLYEASLWPTVLASEEFSSRLAHRGIFGTISHEDKKVDDKDLREGKVSHIVSCLEVREDEKTHKPYLYGELDILDTPAGRILEAMYKGGANLYVSSRAAGKLYPVAGQNYSLVKPESYYVNSFDVVMNPGFLQAKPVYEGVVEESKEEKIQESKVEDVKEVKEQSASESSEIQLLKSQIDKLAKIVEKVVDDVYEQPEAEQSVEEQLGDLLNNSSVTDEAYEDVIAILKNAKPELLNKIMENSRGRFNDEHAEKSGLKIDYYRFGGNKPYKIVPKDKSYFEASWDSPRYRTLKQAQKHVLDSYNKPKETNEALGEAVSLLVSSNLSKPVLEDIIDTLIKSKKQ